MLHTDLIDCIGDGIVIAADNVTLDLNGHKIDRVGVGVGANRHGLGAGVNNSAGHKGVKITNGIIQGFDTGVQAIGASQNRLRNLKTSGNGSAGILLTGSHNYIARNTMPDGIWLVGSNNRVAGNTLSSPFDHGIFVEGVDNRVIRNRASGNASGITLRGSGNGVFGNRVANTSALTVTSGIQLQGGSEANRIARNTVSGPARVAGINLEESDHNRIRQNIVTVKSSFFVGGGILLSGSDGNLVTENTLADQSGHGIVVYHSASNSIDGNLVNKNGQAFTSADFRWITSSLKILPQAASTEFP